ncbi:TetR/AcrR family transcriptional regulator [Aquitalea sp. LB_tupeE]|uniref:TetR/AcrR family transcriptional regulator n=1 Tax=Aquitalea sp. LB_tupeE TaxID=2748078 RepID=UPI0015BFEB9E|nr:TetR/AcrR family transcriptional regulator [Aquitalea sp. LB_tupeE]NWK79668.1 TetR/AcrR family transcriptional regulator [Aquitalea sp. LB_tupeE]
MRTKSEERRQAMVATAAELFLQRGYEATSMAEICSRVGGSKATLYGYFKSKEELFLSVMKMLAEERMSQAYARLVPGGDIAAALQAFGENYLQVILGPDLMAMRGIIAGELVRAGAAQQFYEAGPRQGWNRVAVYLEAEMQAGRLRLADGWIAAMHLLSLIQAEYQQTFLVGVVSEDDMELLQERVARGVEIFMTWYGA